MGPTVAVPIDAPLISASKDSRVNDRAVPYTPPVDSHFSTMQRASATSACSSDAEGGCYAACPEPRDDLDAVMQNKLPLSVQKGRFLVWVMA